MLQWRIAAETNTGCQRQHNEDCYFISPDEHMFAVADGMGGVAAGAVASKLAIEAIDKFWIKSSPDLQKSTGIQEWLNEAIHKANHDICQMSRKNVNMRGMGTTLIIAVQSKSNLLQIAHVGDSRAYLIREGKLTLLTADHSVVQEMVTAGRLTREQARMSPYRHLITRCLGHEPEVQIDQTLVRIRPQDRVLLCSDGLTAVLHDKDIEKVLQKGGKPDKICHELVQETLEAGAPDNVTVVVIDYLNLNASQHINQNIN